MMQTVLWFCITILVAVLVGIGFAVYGVFMVAAVLGMIALYFVLLARDYPLAAVLVLAVHLYLDWYLAFRVIGLMMAGILLFLFFMVRSERMPWIRPRFLWLWFLFLILTIWPALRGAFTRYDALFYYPNVIASAFLMFWLGTLIAMDINHLRRFFQLLTVLALVLACLTLVQSLTGQVILSVSHYDEIVNSNAFEVSGTDVRRAGLYFIDPNWNGAFMALIIFIPLSLLLNSGSLKERGFYLATIVAIIIALMSTYSNGAWIGVITGLVIFVILIGRLRYQFAIIICMVVVTAVVGVAFSSQINTQLQRVSDPSDLLLRMGAWRTALNIIQAQPFTGVGLGLYAYLERAEPYRDDAQFIPLAHPHDSYLEWAAMAGIPVLLIFLALLFTTWWSIRRVWKAQVDAHARQLIVGGLVASVALSMNSISINGWTLPPLCAIGWMILGTVSSPLLLRNCVERE